MYQQKSTSASGPRRFLICLSAVTSLAILSSACGISIENIEMPSTGYTSSGFEVGLDLICLPYQGGEIGYCAALLPDGWSTDTVYYTGDCEGGMTYNSICSDYLFSQFGEPTGYVWSGFVADSASVLLDSFHVNVTLEVVTDSVPGIFWLAFQAGWTYDPDDPDSYAWDDPPHYGNEIEISPLSLVQTSWGMVKALFSE